MAAPFYYLYDGTNILNLDAKAYKIDLGTPKRRYSISPYAGAHGGYVKGQGLYGTREIKITLRFHNKGGNNTWNATRNDLFNYINKMKHENLWFYILHNDDSTSTKVRIYPSPANSEVYNYILVSEPMGFKFLCKYPYFQNTSASSGSESVTDNSQHIFSINNTGKLETSCQFKFTPTGDETFFQVELANNHGFTLEKLSFLAGAEIIYDTGNQKLTIGGVEYKTSQYLTSGSIFNLPIGSNNVYVTCSGAGSFDYSFNTRFI